MTLISECKTDYEKAEALVHLLIDHCTGTQREDSDYSDLRKYFISDDKCSPLLPSWVSSKRSLYQFWQFIQAKFKTYAERREYLWDQFNPLLSRLESGSISPAEADIEEGLAAFTADEISRSWKRMVRRISDDPEGAITASRNLLETVLKHILDERHIAYDSDSIELQDLYKKVQKELNLAPEQHQEDIFKQILGGCSGVVNGLGSMRNKLGDAHGKGKRAIRPLHRHARLAVNLAGSMALFLTDTHHEKTT